MQYLSTLLLSAAAATAAAVPRSTSFQVKQFGFSGTPHSLQAVYSFDVTDGNSAETNCRTTTNTSPSITTFDLTACEDPSWSFAWEPINNSNDTQVIITHLPEGAATNVTAYRTFTPEDIKESEGITPTGNVYYLSTGESNNFELTAY